MTGGALCDFYAVCAASRAKTGMTRLLQQFHVQMVLVVLKLIVSGLNFDKKNENGLEIVRIRFCCHAYSY